MASGEEAPIRLLQGDKTGLADPHGIAVDGKNDLIFNRTDQGHVQPRAVMAGPKTGLTSFSPIQVYPPRGEIIAAVPGRSEELSTASAFVGVWSINDKGDIPPRWTIGGPQGMLKKPRGVTLDPKNKTLMVSDKYLNAVLTYYFPQIF